MAYLLHFDTATTLCSVAISDGAKILALKEVDGTYSHAENLTVFIEEVLKKAAVKKEALSAVAVSKGPGSYTGLRIGVSTAKGLCYALKLPLIAISSLQSMAWAAAQKYKEKDYYFCPMLDAKRMEVYTALYDASGNEIKNISAEIITADFLKDELKEKPIVFFGNGALKCKNILDSPNTIFDDEITNSAKNICALAAAKFEKGEIEDLAYFEPYYLKEFIAGKGAS